MAITDASPAKPSKTSKACSLSMVALKEEVRRLL